MIGHPWMMSWFVSGAVWIAALIAFMRAGFYTTHAFVMSIPFFTAPLGIALGGSNSFVYLADFLPLFLMVMLPARWRMVPRRARRIGVALLFAIGVVPLALTLALRPERNDILFGLANIYRLFTAVGLFWMACVVPVRPDRIQNFRNGRWLAAFAMAAVVLSIAILLQYLGIIEANVFYHWEGELVQNQDDATSGLAVAGLFRGSLGYIGVMGVAAFAAARGRDKWMEIIGIVGAVGGLLLIVIVGSKTSLVIYCLIFGMAFIKSASTGFTKWAATMIVIAAAIAVLARFILPLLPESYTNRVFGVFTASDISTDTIEIRFERWQMGFSAIFKNPMILFGAALPEDVWGDGLILSFWHNEYLGLLMNGGIIVLGAYIGALVAVGREIYARFSRFNPTTVFAGLLMINGLLQAFSVCHLVPGLFFSATVSLSLMAYGLVFNNAADPVFDAGSDEYSTIVTVPVPPALELQAY